MTKRKINRVEILKEVIVLADNKGLYNFTLKELADSLNIKTPSLYNHIKGLEELYNLLAEEGLRQLHAAILYSAVGLSGKKALSAMGHAYINFAFKMPSLYLAAQNASHFLSHEAKKLSDEVVNSIRKILSIYDFSEEQEIHILRTLRGYLHGFASLESQSSFKMDINKAESFELGLEAIFNGFKLDER